MPDENRPASEPEGPGESGGPDLPDIERSVPGSRAADRELSDDVALGHGVPLDELLMEPDDWYAQVYRGGDGLRRFLFDTGYFEARPDVLEKLEEFGPDWESDRLWDEVLSDLDKSAIYGRHRVDMTEQFVDPPEDDSGADDTHVPDETEDVDGDAESAASTGWAHRQDSSYITVTLPDGSVVHERHGDGSEGEKSALIDRRGETVGSVERDFEDLDPGVAARRRRRVVIGVATLVALFVAGGIVATQIGGDDPSDADGAEVVGATTPVGSDPDPPVTESTDDAALAPGTNRPWPDDAAGTACKTAHDEQRVLQLSSPAMGLAEDTDPSGRAIHTIGEEYSLSVAPQTDFPSPPLAWSDPPPETTEIVVTVHDLLASRVDDFLATPGDLWWNGLPTGRVKWQVAGIDPDATGLPATSYVNPDLAGGVELDHGTRVGTSDGVDSTNRFIGPDIPGRHYLFTVFALCDPILNGNEYQESWLVRFAVGIGSFVAVS